MTTRDREWVAARRSVARALHPDRGSDAHAFVAALAAVDGCYRPTPVDPRAPITVIVRHARLRRLVNTGRRAARHLPHAHRRRYATL